MATSSSDTQGDGATLMHEHSQHVACDYDVVVIGGAVAGSAFAMQLLRRHPKARVLMIERAMRFDRKVGEATVETSGWFFTKVLNVGREIAASHLPKYGLRFWSSGKLPDGSSGDHRKLYEMSELGPGGLASLPSYHIDRAIFDEQLLVIAQREGATLARPAQVRDVELGWPQSKVTYSQAGDDERRTVTTRWVIDASGRSTYLAKKLDLLAEPQGHPTAAAWARWDGVPQIDSPKISGAMAGKSRFPQIVPSRSLSTNHFFGRGWWCWVIPLVGGQTSVGIVYNRELFQLPGEGKLKDRYERYMRSQPGLRDLLADATMVDDDFLAYRNLPYYAKQCAGKGWLMVGDAAAFLDPFYSPGLDYMAFSTYSASLLIDDDLSGRLCEKGVGERVASHNEWFLNAYHRWMKAIYIGKYELFGDFELVCSSYFFDIGMYYIGVVGAVVRDPHNYRVPVMGTPQRRSTWACAVMSAYKRRVVKLAKIRRELGVPMRTQTPLDKPWRQYPAKFELGGRAARLALYGLRLWLAAERRTLVHRMALMLGLRRRTTDVMAEEATTMEPRPATREM
jgi:flavin-dependent dehydrogenase